MTQAKLAIIGDGKMGLAVRGLAVAAGFDVVAFLGEADVSSIGPTPTQLAGADVAIEFTMPTAAPANIVACARAGVPVVCGTTGWADQRSRVEDAVREAGGALFASPNFSVGVHLYSRIVAFAAAELAAIAERFDVHMVETHHVAKKDAPSGTARLLADRLQQVLGREVPITSIRTADVPGTHELVLHGPFEQIRLTHEARDRQLFAAGALTAARWVVGKKGIFTMDDLLETR